VEKVNIDNIEAFIYVVHFNSIHKAADILFLSQPTVTARIKTLERELEVELFIRQGRGLILTDKGKEFLPFAEQMIRTFQQAKKQLNKGSSYEEITIGANIITSQYFIPFALPLWKKAYPNLQFKFITASNDTLMEKLLQKQVDFVFMKEIEHNRLEKHELLDNSVRLVAYPGHSFQFEKIVSLQQVAIEPLIFFECGAFDWNRVRKIFEVSQLEPNIVFQADHLEVAKSLILSGDGIGFLPYLCVKKELEQGILIEVDVANFKNMKQSIFLVHGNDKVAPPILFDEIFQSARVFEERQKKYTLSID
jgi:LysR family transcriptional regulator, low CO2-responsive transcriptional regulator